MMRFIIDAYFVLEKVVLTLLKYINFLDTEDLISFL